MAKYMTPVGFVVGVYLGFLTRDNYNYGITKAMDDITRDYQQNHKDIQARLAHQQTTITAMKIKVEAAEKQYMKLKEEQYEEKQGKESDK